MRGAINRNAIGALIGKLLRFGLTSGGGLMLDILLFLLLGSIGVPPFVANLVSATVGVSFVYFISVRRIFSYGGDAIHRLFLVYLAYQALAVTAASGGVALIVSAGASLLLAKLAILPVTFTANYLFMHLLTRQTPFGISTRGGGSESGDA